MNGDSLGEQVISIESKSPYYLHPSVKNTKDDSFTEQMQPPSMEVFEHEDHGVEFPICEEDDYPSLCGENIDHLQKENVKGNLFDILYDEPQEIADNLSENKIIEKFLFPDHLIAQNPDVRSYQDGDF